MNHVELAILFLTVMVLFLIAVGLLQLREIRRLALRLSYVEGTTDMIADSQTRLNESILVYMRTA